MYAIQYLSTTTRAEIEKYKKRLEITTDPVQRDLLRGKISTQEAQTKPHTECNLEELDDLRGQIYEKASKLAGIRKYDASNQFRQMIQFVEQQMQFKMMEKTEDDKKEKVRVEGVRAVKENRPTPTETKSGRSRWSVGAFVRTAKSAITGDL